MEALFAGGRRLAVLATPRVEARNSVIQQRRRHHRNDYPEHKLCPASRTQRAEGHNHQQDWDIQEVRERRQLFRTSAAQFWLGQIPGTVVIGSNV